MKSNLFVLLSASLVISQAHASELSGAVTARVQPTIVVGSVVEKTLKPGGNGLTIAASTFIETRAFRDVFQIRCFRHGKRATKDTGGSQGFVMPESQAGC